MRMLVLGAGLQGCACAYDLLRNPAVEQVTLADLRADKLPPFLSAADWKGRLRTVRLDVSDSTAVRATFAGQAAVMSAIPYYYNGSMAKAAVEAIRSGTAIQLVAIVAAGEAVGAALAVQAITVDPTLEGIVVSPAIELVLAGQAAQGVVAR
jgi:saccharopine dehydrogenase-like NADP-dependent oxidoreductase